MAEKKIVLPGEPIVLHGVMRGKKTIELDEEYILPDGYPVTLHLILKPGETFKLAQGWADMTPEEVADLEAHLSQMRGRPVKLS